MKTTNLPRNVFKTRAINLIDKRIAAQAGRRYDALEEREPDRKTATVCDEIIDELAELRKEMDQL